MTHILSVLGLKRRHQVDVGLHRLLLGDACAQSGVACEEVTVRPGRGIPFLAVHASHFALPFRSRKPGRAAWRQRAVSGGGAVAQSTRRWRTRRVVAQVRLLEQAVEGQLQSRAWSAEAHRLRAQRVERRDARRDQSFLRSGSPDPRSTPWQAAS